MGRDAVDQRAESCRGRRCCCGRPRGRSCGRRGPWRPLAVACHSLHNGLTPEAPGTGMCSAVNGHKLLTHSRAPLLRPCLTTSAPSHAYLACLAPVNISPAWATTPNAEVCCVQLDRISLGFTWKDHCLDSPSAAGPLQLPSARRLRAEGMSVRLEGRDSWRAAERAQQSLLCDWGTIGSNESCCYR